MNERRDPVQAGDPYNLQRARVAVFLPEAGGRNV